MTNDCEELLKTRREAALLETAESAVPTWQVCCFLIVFLIVHCDCTEQSVGRTVGVDLQQR